jgi:hypothetical protein
MNGKIKGELHNPSNTNFSFICKLIALVELESPPQISKGFIQLVRSKNILKVFQLFSPNWMNYY